MLRLTCGRSPFRNFKERTPYFMIADSIQNLDTYASVHPRFPKAFAFLKELLKNPLENGRYPCPDCAEGEIFANVSSYDSRPMDQAIMEVHHKYIDIQVVVSGEEKIYLPALEAPSITKEFNDAGDCAIFSMPDPMASTCLTLSANTFAVFLPNEIHGPNLAARESVPVKKIVVKVLN